MMPLWQAHHAETSDNVYGPLDPDLSVYEQLDLGGRLRIFTATHAGELVGYQVFIVSEHLHSKDWIQASQDILYFRPEHRKGLTAYRFIKWCMNQLREDGISVVHQMVPVKAGIGPLFERLGYQKEDVSYSRCLLEAS